MNAIVDSRTLDPKKLIKGAHRRLGDRARHGDPCAGDVEAEAVLRRLDGVRRRAERPCLAGRRRHAGHAAGDQRGVRRAGDPHRARPQGADQPEAPPSTGRTTSTRTCRRAIRSASTSSPIVGEGEVVVDLPETAGRSRSASSGCIWSRTPASRCTTSIPTMSFVDLNRSGVALMEIVSKPDMRSSEEARAYVTKLRTILRYLGTCDGDMEKGNLRADVNVSVRRPGEPLRHALRDQERQLDPLHRPGDRERGAPADRHPRGWRHDRPGDAAVRSRPRARRARCAPRKRRTTTATSPTRTCCRWNSTRPMSTRSAQHLPELPDAKKARFIADYGLSPYDAGVLVAEQDQADYLRGRRQGPRRQGGGELGDQRAVRPAQQGRQGHRRPRRFGRAARRHRRPDRRGRDLRQDRQGPVRDRLDRGRRPARARREPRHEAGHRHRRDRGGRRRHDRRQPGQGRAGQGQADHDRLVRRAR